MKFIIIFYLADVPGCIANRTLWKSGDKLCPEKSALAPLLLAVYMILTNVLLLNLLIAMFR